MSLDVVGWLDEQLAAAGRTRTGEPELHRERTWASVHRVPTDAGDVWLKSMPPATAFEARLYPVLTAVVPERVLVPLAVDPDRGLLLLPDAGPSFGEQFDDDALATPMQAALRAYGEAQQQLAPHVDAMVEAGVADMRPRVMPERFEQALDFARDYAGPDDADAVARLTAIRAHFAEWCAELTDSRFAPSIDHNDLHAWNVVGSPAQPRFYDWGDAVLAHPFAALLTPLDTLPEGMRADVRDAYLRAFGDPDALRAEAALAARVAYVARAHVWLRALGERPAEHEHAHAPFAHLLRVLGDGS